MATHQHYYEIEADSYYELGHRKGELFGEYLLETLDRRKSEGDWALKVMKAGEYVAPSQKAFPNLIQEVHGYAEGARSCFEDLWLLMLEDELDDHAAERCTTVVTNRGKLIGHNEDWERNATNSIVLLRRKVGGLSVFELYYLNTLGGNAISFNSHGHVHAVNSLCHTDNQLGIPKNVIARWLSETSDPERDYKMLQMLQRASGFHHCIVSPNGETRSLECSAARQILTESNSPFVHTNHYLTQLTRFEGDDQVPGTRRRYKFATRHARDPMSPNELRKMLSDKSEGPDYSVFNERTIAQMIFDLERKQAYAWLRREKDKGWVVYPL